MILGPLSNLTNACPSTLERVWIVVLLPLKELGKKLWWWMCPTRGKIPKNRVVFFLPFLHFSY